MISRYEKLYGKEYFDRFLGGEYLQNDRIRRNFRLMAKHLKNTIGGTTHLDVGCAAGFLVDSMRSEGYNSTGIDLPYIVNKSPVSGLYAHSIADRPFYNEAAPSGFDVVTCIEVLEHLYPDDISRSIKNLSECVASNGYLVFSSSPYDLVEPTHFSVHPVEWWADNFESLGFVLTRFSYNPIPWLFILQKDD